MSARLHAVTPLLLRRFVASAVVITGLAITALAGCGNGAESDSGEGELLDETEVVAATPTAKPEAAEESPTPPPEPVRFIPAGRIGAADAYEELITRLEAEVPPELINEIPWPDLRNPDPAVAQTQIFDMWIWMAQKYPEPVLIDVLAAPGGPSLERVASVFGELDRDNRLEVRTAAPYRAFDHLVVTFESAGLPLWLARDVPDDAVVVYYSDNSGPVETRDRDTGEVLDVRPASGTRTWLSIMVPTEVGWLLWRDQLIDPRDSELEVPDLELPSPDAGKPKPQV